MDGQYMHIKEPMREAMTHIVEHMHYPATKTEIVQACDNMSDVPVKDKRWLIDHLPERTYQDVDEAKMALNLE